MSSFAKIILCLILFATSLFACTNANPEPEWKTYGPYYLGEAKDYIFFNKGTWWVYEDSDTKVRDSIVVQSSILDTVIYNDNYDGSSGNMVIREYFEVSALSFLDDYKYWYRIIEPFVWANVTSEGLDDFWIEKYKSKPGDPNGSKVVFLTPFNNQQPNLIKLVSADSTIQIGLLMFNKVVVYEVLDDYTSDIKDTRYYWAKNIGLILLENLETGNRQQLVNYKIVQ